MPGKYSNKTQKDITNYISYSKEPLTQDDTEFIITFPHVMYQNKNGQAGVEFTDFIIVLRTMDAVKTFGGNLHFSVGAGVGVAAGIVGRVAEADIRAGNGGLAACYTYSCSKGNFVELTCEMKSY